MAYEGGDRVVPLDNVQLGEIACVAIASRQRQANARCDVQNAIRVLDYRQILPDQSLITCCVLSGRLSSMCSFLFTYFLIHGVVKTIGKLYVEGL